MYSANLERMLRLRKPPFESVYIYLLMMFLGFMVADLAILSYRENMLPIKAPPPSQRHVDSHIAHGDPNAYNNIVARNIFNSDGVIPDPIGATGGKGGQDGPPIPSQLPLSLIGTIVHANPDRSVATINLRNKNEDMAFSVGDDIDSLATLTKVERGKAIFRNKSTQRLEFIELKKEGHLTFGISAPKAGGDVTQVGDSDFNIKREDLNRLTQNLPDLLQQARAVPNILPNGRVDGFRLVEIQPGSVYERLGLKRDDVIKSVNGEPVDSPAKAMELYNALRNSSNISLGIERDGRPSTKNYNVQ